MTHVMDQLLDQGIVEYGLDHKLKNRNTAILADTFHFESLSMHEFSGSTSSLLTICEYVCTKQADYYVWIATKRVLESWQKERRASKLEELASLVTEHLFAELASVIYDNVQGPHLAFVDPRYHADAQALVKSARRMRRLLVQRGIPKRDAIIGIPATDAGLSAARILWEDNVNVNLYLVSGLTHAAACVEAKATMISIAVGPLLEAYEQKRRSTGFYTDLNAHPGIETMQSILGYFKLNGIKTKVIGTSFRTLAEIGLLSECDAVCVSASQVNALRWSNVPISSLEDAALPANFRARQAKYPTDLLTRGKSFTTWLSPETKRLTNRFLSESLKVLNSEMRKVHIIVAKEINRQFNLAVISNATSLNMPTWQCTPRSREENDHEGQ